MITTSDGRRSPTPRRRALWSILASLALNVIVLVTYPHLAFRRNEPHSKAPVVAIVRIERRAPTPRPTKPPTPPPIVRTPVPATPKPRPTAPPPTPAPPPVRKKPVAVLPKRRRPHVQPPSSKLPERDIAGSPSMSFQHRGTNLKMPPTYSTQDLSNGAATDITKYVDFTKAKGAFVPQVWVVHLNVSYLTAPTLDAAVQDIVASLAPDDAKISVSKPQTVCHGTVRAWFLAYSRPGQDLPGAYENILFLKGDTMYREMYSRPLGQAEDPAARAAMNAACPASTVPPHI